MIRNCVKTSTIVLGFYFKTLFYASDKTKYQCENYNIYLTSVFLYFN